MPETAPVTFSRTRLDAVLFDLDGVVTRTARVHAAAWKAMFDAYLRERPPHEGEDHSPFDEQRDYRRYVDGRPRVKGVKHFLAARGVDLPEGNPNDPPERETLWGLGNRKNERFRQALGERGVERYDCAVDLLHRLREAGFRTAVVTASKNCDLILKEAGLADLFNARVDGVEAARLELAGKPDPDTFLEAAARLHCDPARTAVLEDAVAGVRAGRRGNFGLVVGVDRSGQADALADAGADRVVADLCAVTVTADAIEPPPLLDDPGPLLRRLADRRPALFLDYDGTLTPIVERPEDALLSPDMRAALRAAAEAMPLAIISGRDLDDVQALVDLPKITYAGSHGFDIRGPDIALEQPDGVDALDDLAQAAETLQARLAHIPGAQVERKRFAVAVHYRRVATELASQVEDAVAAVAERSTRLRRTGGKKIYELRPDIDWDKGRAVTWLIGELGLDGPDVLPIYIGDDETDEDAFRALAGRGGIGLLVADGEQASAAAWRLSDPDAVGELLRALTAAETDPR
ncbi:MAG: trehalose-phosphatase [Thiohalocapsa sp.]|jgi:alpha,alpha-trehalase